jgi:DNA-binding NarL/FixJ family response regulator
VLSELHDGVGVRYIAQGSDVAEATVRTQVKAILRKLDVSSQIAAVAAYTQVRTEPAEDRRTNVP